MIMWLTPALRATLVIFVFFFLNGVAYACNCAPESDCGALSNSRSVYEGTLIKVEEEERDSQLFVRAYFSVERVYKGAVRGRTESLTFRVGNCERSFRMGEKYIVFQEENDLQSICNRTDRTANIRPTKEFLDRIYNGDPSFQIGIDIIGLTEKDLLASRFSIDAKTFKIESPSAGLGLIRIKSLESSKHKLRMVIPRSVEIEVKDGLLDLTSLANVERRNGKTTIMFEIDLSMDRCSFRQMFVHTLAQ